VERLVRLTVVEAVGMVLEEGETVPVAEGVWEVLRVALRVLSALGEERRVLVALAVFVPLPPTPAALMYPEDREGDLEDSDVEEEARVAVVEEEEESLGLVVAPMEAEWVAQEEALAEAVRVVLGLAEGVALALEDGDTVKHAVPVRVARSGGGEGVTVKDGVRGALRLAAPLRDALPLGLPVGDMVKEEVLEARLLGEGGSERDAVGERWGEREELRLEEEVALGEAEEVGESEAEEEVESERVVVSEAELQLESVADLQGVVVGESVGLPDVVFEGRCESVARRVRVVVMDCVELRVEEVVGVRRVEEVKVEEEERLGLRVEDSEELALGETLVLPLPLMLFVAVEVPLARGEPETACERAGVREEVREGLLLKLAQSEAEEEREGDSVLLVVVEPVPLLLEVTVGVRWVLRVGRMVKLRELLAVAQGVGVVLGVRVMGEERERLGVVLGEGERVPPREGLGVVEADLQAELLEEGEGKGEALERALAENEGLLDAVAQMLGLGEREGLWEEDWEGEGDWGLLGEEAEEGDTVCVGEPVRLPIL
jgi:hypothetical protein